MMERANKILALLALGIVVFLPNAAFAADGDIFSIISNKMITTIQDVRKIVYVVAGFGLIMFAVLAVFNKISFKHLAYIMIGLSLLSVMMPFINYFSGANLQDSEYVYDNFIAGGDASILGSNVSDQTDCTGAICPDATEGEEGAANGGREPFEPLDEIDSSGLGLPGGVEGLEEGGLAGLDSLTTPYDSNGCRTVNGKQECCEGKVNKKGQCKKSFKDTIKNIVSVGKDVINAGKNVANAVEYGMGIVDTVKEGAQNIGDVISGDGNIFDKVKGLADSVGSTAFDLSSGANSGLSGIQNALGNIGSASDTIRGDNKVSDAINNSGVNDVIENTQDTISDARKDVGDFANDMGSLAGSGNDALNLGNRVGDWFKGK